MVLAPMSTRHPPEFRTTHGGRPASATTCASAVLACRSDSATDRMTISGAVKESAKLVTLRVPVGRWPHGTPEPPPGPGGPSGGSLSGGQAQGRTRRPSARREDERTPARALERGRGFDLLRWCGVALSPKAQRDDGACGQRPKLRRTPRPSPVMVTGLSV